MTKIITKSESARLVAEGKAHEAFIHETLGEFNVTALRWMISNNQFEVLRCSFDAIQMVDGIKCDALEYLIGHREVDYSRCKELTTKQLDEPLIFLECPEGTNGEQASQLLVDGIHRLVERKRRGLSFFDYYLIPLADAPRVDHNEYGAIPWGEMEVVPGKGLVKRE